MNDSEWGDEQECWQEQRKKERAMVRTHESTPPYSKMTETASAQRRAIPRPASLEREENSRLPTILGIVDGWRPQRADHAPASIKPTGLKQKSRKMRKDVTSTAPEGNGHAFMGSHNALGALESGRRSHTFMKMALI